MTLFIYFKHIADHIIVHQMPRTKKGPPSGISRKRANRHAQDRDPNAMAVFQWDAHDPSDKQPYYAFFGRCELDPDWVDSVGRLIDPTGSVRADVERANDLMNMAYKDKQYVSVARYGKTVCLRTLCGLC